MTTVEQLVSETREDIPLKLGKKSSKWYSCDEDCFSGLKFINVAFGTLTFIISLALVVQIYYGDYQVVPHGSVATDSLECSKVGTLMLKRGGNAVDAAIATAFCLAVATPHVTGLDAEGLMLIYNHKIGTIPTVIDFSNSVMKASDRLPRLVLALAYIHREYGSLSWESLVKPAADLARQGYVISRMLVEAITTAKAEDLYGRLEAGQMLRHDNLAGILDQIANTPESELYEYLYGINKQIQSEAQKLTFYGYDIYVPNAPSIGSLLFLNLQELQKFNFTKEDTTKPEYTYRIAETTQVVYGQLNISTRFHEGTLSNVAVIDTNDVYVSLVTGMYEFFGSGEITSHGYVLDVKDKDKPCSWIPLIITDASFICGRRIVVGANDIAHATQIITSMVISEEDATAGIEAPRFHILSNGTVGIEGSHLPSFTDDILKYLETLTSKPFLVREPYQSSNIVEKIKDDLNSHSDSRGGGIASRF